MIMQLHQFALKVGEAASKLKSVEIAMGDVHEEFLDPILSTIMNDPVILPNYPRQNFHCETPTQVCFHYDIYIDNILVVFHCM